jgi:hypothetical protein
MTTRFSASLLDGSSIRLAQQFGNLTGLPRIRHPTTQQSYLTMPTSAWRSFATISSAKCRFCGMISLLQIGNAKFILGSL